MPPEPEKTTEKFSQLFFLRSHSLVDLAGWGGDLLTVTGQAANSSKHSTTYDAAMELIGHKDKVKHV